MGYQAAMVRTPHYYKNLISRGDAQMLYYRSVADRTKIPLIHLQLAADHRSGFPAEAVAALSEHPNIIAIKESSGNLEKVMQMIREVKHDFQVLVGSAPTLWPSLLMGACGAILAYCQRSAVFDDRHLGSLPHARRSRRHGLAEPHRPPLRAGDRALRDSRLEICHGPERLLRRPSAPSPGSSHSEAKQEIEAAFQDLKG